MTIKELMDELSWYDEDTQVEVYVSYNNGNNGISAELDRITYESGIVVFNGSV